MNIYRVVINDDKPKSVPAGTGFEELVKGYNEIPGNEKLDDSVVRAIRKYLGEYRAEDEYPYEFIEKNKDVYDTVIFKWLDDVELFKRYVDLALDRSDDIRVRIDELYRTLNEDVYPKSYIKLKRKLAPLFNGKLRKIMNGEIVSDGIRIPVELMDRVASYTIRIYTLTIDRFHKGKDGSGVRFERNVPMFSTPMDAKRQIESILAAHGIQINTGGSNRIDTSGKFDIDKAGNRVEKNVKYNLVFSEPREGRFAPPDADAVLDINVISPIDDESELGSKMDEHRDAAYRAAKTIARFLRSDIKDMFKSAVGSDRYGNVYAYHLDMRLINYDSLHGRDIVKEDGFSNDNYSYSKYGSGDSKYGSSGSNDQSGGLTGGENTPKLSDLGAWFVAAYDENQLNAMTDAIGKINEGLGNGTYYSASNSGITNETVKDRGTSSNDPVYDANTKAGIAFENCLNKYRCVHDNRKYRLDARNQQSREVGEAKATTYMIPLNKLYTGKVMFAEKEGDIPYETSLPKLINKYLLGNSAGPWKVYRTMTAMNADMATKYMKGKGVKPFSYDDYGLKADGYDTQGMNWDDKQSSEFDKALDDLMSGKAKFDPNKAYENNPIIRLHAGNATMVEKHGFNYAFVVTFTSIADANLDDSGDLRKLHREIQEAIDASMPENIVEHVQYISNQNACYGYDEIAVISFNYRIKENYKGKKDYMEWLNEIEDAFMTKLHQICPNHETHESDIMTYDKVDSYVTELVRPAYSEAFDALKKRYNEPLPKEEAKQAKPETPENRKAVPSEAPAPKLETTSSMPKSYDIVIAISDPDGSNYDFINAFVNGYLDSHLDGFVVSDASWNTTLDAYHVTATAKSAQSTLDAKAISLDAMRRSICDAAMNEWGFDDGVAELISRVDVKEK